MFNIINVFLIILNNAPKPITLTINYPTQFPSITIRSPISIFHWSFKFDFVRLYLHNCACLHWRILFAASSR